MSGSISSPSFNNSRRTGDGRYRRTSETAPPNPQGPARSRIAANEQGRKPSSEEVAGAAPVSRATAYRYFPRAKALLAEAAPDVVAPSPEEVFKRAPAADPVARVERVDAAFDAMITANEASLRMMLAQSMEHSIAADGAKLPKRQNRRLPLIEAALAPASKQFKLADLQMLSRSLALVIGTEGTVVFKDVLQISYAEARKKSAPLGDPCWWRRQGNSHTFAAR